LSSRNKIEGRILFSTEAVWLFQPSSRDLSLLIIETSMTKDFLFNFIRKHNYGVLSTVSADNTPQSAYLGIAVTPELKIIFDTVSDSRKYRNMLIHPAVSLVIGWDNEQTIQYQGTATIPDSDELELLLPIYFSTFPDGKIRKDTWKNIAYFCIEPKWIRYSDFNEATRTIEEMKF
jgi:general stress protein 26